MHSPDELLRLAMSNTISPDEFEKELWSLSTGHSRRGRKYNAGEVRIYRTRIWRAPERPRSTTDFSYPPKSVTPLGRANFEGEPIFYASAALPPSFVECRLMTGDHVVCSEWRTTAELVLQEVGLSDGWKLSDTERIYHEIFTAIDPAMYKYSACVARHLVSGPQISGLLYPSMAAQNASHNLALKTEFVDSGLRFVNASLYHVKSASAAFQYEVEEMDFALPNADGSLNWKGRKRQWVLRSQGDSLKMVSTGWSWDAYDPAGVLVDPE